MVHNGEKFDFEPCTCFVDGGARHPPTARLALECRIGHAANIGGRDDRVDELGRLHPLRRHPFGAHIVHDANIVRAKQRQMAIYHVYAIDLRTK